jgi:hypothetical protein
MPDQANDGRPDVEIRSRVYEEGPGDMGEWVLTDRVTHEAACRWCPESFLSPDVRSVVKWADVHETQRYHLDLKADRSRNGVGPREPWS